MGFNPFAEPFPHDETPGMWGVRRRTPNSMHAQPTVTTINERIEWTNFHIFSIGLLDQLAVTKGRRPQLIL